jgi:hypothetical protein
MFKCFERVLNAVLSQAVSCRPFTAELQFRSQASLCEICGGYGGTGIGFTPSISVFIPPIPVTRRHIQVAVSKIGEHCEGKYFSPSLSLLMKLGIL